MGCLLPILASVCSAVIRLATALEQINSVHNAVLFLLDHHALCCGLQHAKTQWLNSREEPWRCKHT